VSCSACGEDRPREDRQATDPDSLYLARGAADCRAVSVAPEGVTVFNGQCWCVGQQAVDLIR
jgi:hypothetical protein